MDASTGSTFGELLRSYRDSLNLTQEELAGRTGLTPQAVGLLERGRRSPNLETLQRLATALGVELADFFPKAEAPLPFHDVDGPGRRSPFLEAWMSFLHRLAREWEDALPEDEEVRSFPKLAFEVSSRNELVQAEFLMLVELVSKSIKDAARVEPSPADLKELLRALSRVYDVAELWASSAENARDAVRQQTLDGPMSCAWFESPEGQQWLLHRRAKHADTRAWLATDEGQQWLSRQRDAELERQIAEEERKYSDRKQYLHSRGITSEELEAQSTRPPDEWEAEMRALMKAESTRAEEGFERAAEKRRNAAAFVRNLHNAK